MTDIATFVDRYINIWNEPDPDRRRLTIRELWHEDAHHLARRETRDGPRERELLGTDLQRPVEQCRGVRVAADPGVTHRSSPRPASSSRPSS